MKTKKHLLAAAVLMVLTACTQEEETTSLVPVRLTCTTVTAIETRAAQNLHNGTLTNGEYVKVLTSNTGVNDWTEYSLMSRGNGTLTGTTSQPCYPEGDQRIDIAACFPSSAGETFTVAANQTSDDSYKASDLMFASITNQAKTTEAVNLSFTHLMAKVCVNVTPGTGISSITGISLLNVRPTVAFSPTTGTVGEAQGNATTITMSNNGAACIPAQTITGSLLAITTDKGTATYNVLDGKTFQQGKQYTINVTVNLLAIGATNAITGWTSEGTITVNPVYEPSNAPDGLQAVDLGLSVKWANMNVGATTETDYGTYFAWAETKGYTVVGATTTPAEGNEKITFSWYSYLWSNGSENSLTKYCNYNYYWDDNINNDTPDGKIKMDLEDDAAHANWGGNWRMPTSDELTELMNTKDNSDYTWTWCDGSTTSYNGSTVVGLKIVYNATNATIFLPFAGSREENEIYESGTKCCYWSSSLKKFLNVYANGAEMALFSDSFVEVLGVGRYIGTPVRAVTK